MATKEDCKECDLDGDCLFQRNDDIKECIP